MRIRLVCFDDAHDWILGKFAHRMNDCLTQLGVESDISQVPDNSTHVNHFINYDGFDGVNHAIDTLMITHIDNIDKLNRIQQLVTHASAGICMSGETMRYLARMGVDKNKLCYVNPAHDGVIPIRKTVVGLACRVQKDGRKREYFLDKLAKTLDARYFKFRIMGDGWDPQVHNLRRNGFEVDYYDHFEYSEYVRFIPSLDYYLYMGMDEGQMGFIDALAAGVKTIVTSQGYHLDAPNAIVHPFMNYEELESIFLSLEQEKKMLVHSVSTWDWLHYTQKHLEIWEHLVDHRKAKSVFADGLNSLLLSKDLEIGADEGFVRSKTKELRKAKYWHLFYSKKRRYNEVYASDGLPGVVAAIVKKIVKGFRRSL